jgi:AraC-like DNA-binding protein
VIGETASVLASGGQTYVEHLPIASLRELASSAWIQQVGRDATPYVHRRIPHGAVELVCEVGSTPQVIGPLTEPQVDILEPGTTVVGMRFVPGAFPAVARQPASELVGLALDAEDLWDHSAARLREAVGTAASPQEALTAVQLQVHELARGGKPPDTLVSEVVHGLMPWRARDVASATASVYISETQVRRRFQRAVGLAPKVLHRILRFQGFLALVQHASAQGRAPTDDGLARLAVRAGFADQSHLTRECVRLTSVSPRVFLAETQQACACGHDHSATIAPVLSPAKTRLTRESTPSELHAK